MTRFVDWDFAASTGARLVPAGPSVSAAEALEEVEAIREAAQRVHGPVAETSQLTTPDDAPEPLVVDRGTWIATNARSMGAMLDPAFAEILARRDRQPSAASIAIGSKVTGAEAGALLAFIASKVLGQYDLAPGGDPALLLVAPNIMAARQELGVDARDFRTWVCMHEETHRVQFTAVPWLRTHLVDSARTLATDLTPNPDSLGELVGRITRNLPDLVSGSNIGGIADLVTTPEQRARLADVTAVMSLLEGHADVAMDDVGPAHIPTVATIRERFTARRAGAGAADKVLRRLLGLEAKMRQYRDGAAFVRGVHSRVGVDGFNAVWTSPETLPRAAEIADPDAWVRRVHG